MSDFEPKATVTWTTTGIALGGGDQMEVWVKSHYAGDVWTRVGVVLASLGTATVVLPRFLTNHDLALRVTRGGLPGAGYTGTPDSWPAAARTTFLAGGTVAVFTNGAWSRTSGTRQQHATTYHGPKMGGSHPEITLVCEQSSDGGGTWAAVLSGPSPVKHTNADSGLSFRYRVKAVGPDAETAYVSTADGYLGPADLTGTILDASGFPGTNPHDHLFEWGGGPAGSTVQARGGHVNGTYEQSSATVEADIADGMVLIVNYSDHTAGRPQTARAESRVRVTSFGVDDYSQWVTKNLGGAEA